MPIAVLVLGMHRSGTSATAGLLELAGVDFGSNLTPARDDNPRGFFEHDEVWRLHQQLFHALGSEPHDIRPLPPQWFESAAAAKVSHQLFQVLAKDFSSSLLWGVKDPRLSRLFPIWPPMLERLGASPRVVLTLRHPLESARSMVRRDHRELCHALALWLRYTLDAELGTRRFCRVVSHYADMMSDWRITLSRIDKALSLELPELNERARRTIGTFLDQDLRHQRAEQDWVLADSPSVIAQWCDEVYRAMLSLPDQAAMGVIDKIDASFRELNSQAAAYSGQIQDHIREIHHLRELSSSLKADYDKLVDAARTDRLCSEQVAALEGRLHECRTELLDATTTLSATRGELQRVLGSRSWSITRPLRLMSHGCKLFANGTWRVGRRQG